MRYLPRSVIPFSMMFVVSTGAGKAAHAQDSETGTTAPAFAPTAPDPGPGLSAGPGAKDQAQPRQKRRARADQAQPAEATAPASSGGFGGLNHFLQTGLSLMPGTGYRLTVPYSERLYCGDASGVGGKPVCAHRLPTVLDIQLSFGALARMDVILDFRFGLEEDPAISGSHQFALAPGLRFWLDQDRALKFYTTLQFVYDYTDYSGSPGVSSHDFGIRNANGLMFDLLRNLGLFVQFGETLGFRRWFRIDIDIGLGVQVRFP